MTLLFEQFKHMAGDVRATELFISLVGMLIMSGCSPAEPAVNIVTILKLAELIDGVLEILPSYFVIHLIHHTIIIV